MYCVKITRKTGKITKTNYYKFVGELSPEVREQWERIEKRDNNAKYEFLPYEGED